LAVTASGGAPLCGLTLKAATGAPTVTAWVAVAPAPALSVTVSVTV
jgi:hypothetical protein